MSESIDNIHRNIKVKKEKVKKSNRSMSFGNSEYSVNLSTSDKELGSDHDGLVGKNADKVPTLNKIKKISEKGNNNMLNKQKTQLFDSKRNIDKENEVDSVRHSLYKSPYTNQPGKNQKTTPDVRKTFTEQQNNSIHTTRTGNRTIKSSNTNNTSYQTGDDSDVTMNTQTTQYVNIM